jgi:hypothetical protein
VTPSAAVASVAGDPYVGFVKLAITLMVAMSLVAPSAHARQESRDITGHWQADTPDGPQVIVVRPDSTASFGEETVSWKTASDTVYILFGDEWVGYNFLLQGDSLILSGGDLEEPITLTRVDASPTARGARRPRGGPPANRSRAGLGGDARQYR